MTKIMKPKSIPLHPQYLPEYLDPHHRVLDKSKPLYETWLSEAQDAQDFSSWIKSSPFRSFNISSAEKVLYITNKAELANYQVHFVNGIAEQRSNISGNISIDKLSSPDAGKRQKKILGLVLRADDQFLYAIDINTSDIEIKKNHTSLSAGGDVLFAGEAIVVDGKFKFISDKSGHYKPDLYSLAFCLDYLKTQGVDLSGAKIGVTKDYNTDKRTIYSNAELFMDLYIKQGFEDPQYQGMLDDFASAEKQFSANSDTTKAIYYLKNVNDLYEFTKKDDKILLEAFDDKYHERLNAPASVNTSHSFSSSSSSSFPSDNYIFETPAIPADKSYPSPVCFTLGSTTKPTTMSRRREYESIADAPSTLTSKDSKSAFSSLFDSPAKSSATRASDLESAASTSSVPLAIKKDDDSSTSHRKRLKFE
jgi:hypothetical protein